MQYTKTGKSALIVGEYVLTPPWSGGGFQCTWTILNFQQLKLPSQTKSPTSGYCGVSTVSEMNGRKILIDAY